MYLFIMFAICKYKSRLYVFDDKLEIVLQYMFISIYILYYQGDTNVNQIQPVTGSFSQYMFNVYIFHISYLK